MKKTNKQGFTLVELSIVLVIIGLLIGGILVAQSLIDSTKIQSLTRAIGQYDAAVGTFKDRFGDLPGDSSLFNSTVGDGEGLIDSAVTAAAVNASDWVGETANFWTQLSQTGLKNEEGGDFDNAAASGIVVGSDVPRSPVGANTTGIMAYGEAAVAVLENSPSGNVYIIADCGAMTSATLSCDGGVSGPDGLAIDTKLDDGVGTTGNVSNIDQSGALTTWAALVDGTEEAYDPTDDGDDASMLFIRMGSQLGTLY